MPQHNQGIQDGGGGVTLNDPPSPIWNFKTCVEIHCPKEIEFFLSSEYGLDTGIAVFFNLQFTLILLLAIGVLLEYLKPREEWEMLSPSLLYIHVPVCLASTTESRLWCSCQPPQVTFLQGLPVAPHHRTAHCPLQSQLLNKHYCVRCYKMLER